MPLLIMLFRGNLLSLVSTSRRRDAQRGREGWREIEMGEGTERTRDAGKREFQKDRFLS